MTSVQCYYNLYLPLDFLSILKRGFFENCYLVTQQLKIYHHLFPFPENPWKVDNSQLLLATILFLFSLIQVLRNHRIVCNYGSPTPHYAKYITGTWLIPTTRMFQPSTEIIFTI